MATSGRHRQLHRRRRSPRRIAGLVLLLAVVAGGIAVAVVQPPWLTTLTTRTIEPTVTPPEIPPCPSARLAVGRRIGSVAWTDAGALHLLDLDTCDERVLVQTGADPPVRFSHDGAWVAFGDGAIVPAEGGDVQRPLGSMTAWDWSPTEDALAGATADGALVIGGPGQEPRELLPARSDAGSLAFGPDGRSLAVDLGGDRVVVVEAADGVSRTIYEVSPGTDAPPRVTGWSPDGRWVLFFSRFAGRAGVPLNAVPADGGDWVNVFDPVLPYDDFLSWCGRRRLVLAGGGEQTPSVGNQVLLSGPSAWRYRNLSQDFSRSWIWPACSPDGAWIAATVTPSRTEDPPGKGIRTLWLLAADGSSRRRLTGTANAAFETPRWSADGRFLLVVRRGVEPTDPGNLVLFRFDPSTGDTTRAEEPLATLGPAPGQDGHADWSNVLDWYRG
jgi:dipeptidyl aminopeptidase/acylaminoacyl peptidase